MKILVAGGAGFIGSHLVDTLLEQGHTVDVIDNLVTGREENINHHYKNPLFTLIKADITKEVPHKRYDRIYNLASPASPIDFVRIPIEILLTGAIGQKNLLELAQKYQSRILFASTSEVYGDPLVNPQNEDYFGNVNCRGERACYDEAKRFAEALTINYHRHRKIDTRTVRIFNTYGPRMSPHDGRVVPNFFMQALNNEPLTVYGEGTQTRSLCYVSDMVRGLIALMESSISDAVNIGNTHEMTVREIGDLINQITGSSAGFRHLPLPENDPKQRRPDTTRAETLLKWKAEVSPEEGLKLTKSYFESQLKNSIPLSPLTVPKL